MGESTHIVIDTHTDEMNTFSLINQGWKLGGAGRPGLPQFLLRLPQVSPGSPKMYWFLYGTPINR